MIGRIVRSGDFERVLGTPARARSAHFAVHYLRSRPSRTAARASREVATKLSTAQAPEQGETVDDSSDACWLGVVVPKRHARRAVTRSLLKRQIHQAAQIEPCLPSGLWVVRLRAAFDSKRFSSAGSAALREEARRELSSLIADAVRRTAA